MLSQYILQITLPLTQVWSKLQAVRLYGTTALPSKSYKKADPLYFPWIFAYSFTLFSISTSLHAVPNTIGPVLFKVPTWWGDVWTWWNCSSSILAIKGCQGTGPKKAVTTFIWPDCAVNPSSWNNTTRSLPFAPSLSNKFSSKGTSFQSIPVKHIHTEEVAFTCKILNVIESTQRNRMKICYQICMAW